jgi:hypothetical protein
VDVFISWSGARSHAVAEALRGWLPMVLQTLRVWMSASDIQKGASWNSEITERLQVAKEGIVCLTPENLREPWILFESGAISKQVEKARLCTYLLGLEPHHVPPPLGLFQHTVATKADTHKLLRALNERSETRLPLEQLDALFEATWPSVAEKLAGIPSPVEPVPEQRPTAEMIGEMLDLIRSRNAMDSSSTVLAKLQHIELALFALSYRSVGKAQFEELAFRILEAGRRIYGATGPGSDEITNIWRIFQGVVKRTSTEEGKKDGGQPVSAEEVAAKSSTTLSDEPSG